MGNTRFTGYWLYPVRLAFHKMQIEHGYISETPCSLRLVIGFGRESISRALRTFGQNVGVALVVVLPLAVGLRVAGVAVVQQVTVGRVARLTLVLRRYRLQMNGRNSRQTTLGRSQHEHRRSQHGYSRSQHGYSRSQHGYRRSQHGHRRSKH